MTPVRGFDVQFCIQLHEKTTPKTYGSTTVLDGVRRLWELRFGSTKTAQAVMGSFFWIVGTATLPQDALISDEV